MKRTIFCMLAMSLAAWNAHAQTEITPINTGVANFLTIPTDARSVGMGGAGVALTGNDDAIFHNGATSLLDDTRKGGATYTYIPWMRDYESGHALHSVGGFYKLDKRNALMAGFRYYNYPKLSVVEGEEKTGKDIRPKELAAEIGYARELFSGFALSATFRYIHSDMGSIGNTKPADAVAFDIGALYKRGISGVQGANWTAGLQLSNIGTKIKYLDTKEELPAMVKLGGAVDLPFNPIHRLVVAADLCYRLMPSDTESLNVSAGAEYILMNHFKLRGGYYYGDKDKGDASYATAGLGVNYRGAHLDFSWLFAESDSPLKNTFWVSLGFSF